MVMTQNNYKLVVKETQMGVTNGQMVSDFRGDKAVLTGGIPPKHEGSTGRVLVEGGWEFYPSVYGLEWIKE